MGVLGEIGKRMVRKIRENREGEEEEKGILRGKVKEALKRLKEGKTAEGDKIPGEA